MLRSRYVKHRCKYVCFIIYLKLRHQVGSLVYTTNTMPPVLKVLSLITTILCVVLVFGVVALDKEVTSMNTASKIGIHSSDKKTLFRKKSVIATSTNESVSGQELVATSTKNMIHVLIPETTSAYISFDATSSEEIDFDSLENLGGNYYAGKGAVYYFTQSPYLCKEERKGKLIKLTLDKPDRVTQVKRGNFVTDDQSVFVLFLKIIQADPETFSFVGIAKDEGIDMDKVSSYWFKDKNKIYTLTSRADACSGISFMEEEHSLFTTADVSSFEYLGVDPNQASDTYAKDKNYFYTNIGRVSESVTPQNCSEDFFKECLPRIKSSYGATTTVK